MGVPLQQEGTCSAQWGRSRPESTQQGHLSSSCWVSLAPSALGRVGRGARQGRALDEPGHRLRVAAGPQGSGSLLQH